MNPVAILLDSTCDMTPELLREFGLDYCQMGFGIEEENFPASLGWEKISPHDFYAEMKAGKRAYTSQVPEKEFVKKFDEHLDRGEDILYIACSGALSSSVQAGRKVAAERMEAHPGSKILVVDPLISGMGQGLIGIRAAKERDEGKSVDEIAADLEAEKLKYNQWGTVDDLSYLKKAGRIKASSAFFGNLFGVKPIIISDIKGQNFGYKKVRGRKASLEEIARSVEETAVDPKEHYLAISHADCEEEAYALRDRILAKVPFKGCFVTPLGPILGASCGPKTLIAFHYGKTVTLLGD